MSPEPIDYERSRAILIGVSDYADPELRRIPAALNSLAGLEHVLTDPRLCGWPANRITVMRNPQNAGRVARELRELVRDVRDILLVYFVGHGTLTVRGQLCLAVQDTVADAPEYTGIGYEWVAQALRNSPARVKITILDCCFSGQAIEALAAAESGVADLTHVAGVYTLTATARNTTAHVVPLAEQSGAPTSFTGELLNVINNGLAGGPSHLTLGDIYPVLQQQLAAHGLPRPNQRGTDTADQFPFSRNAATARNAPLDTKPPEVPEPPIGPEPSWAPAADSPLAYWEATAPRVDVPIRSTRPPPIRGRTGVIVAIGLLLVAVAGLFAYRGLADRSQQDTGSPDSTENSTTTTDDPGTTQGIGNDPAGPVRPPAEVIVRVANASGVNGAAATWTDTIQGGGYQTVEATNAAPIRDTTAVLYAEGYDREARDLAEAIGSPADGVFALSSPPQLDPAGANLVILLGTDLLP